jgi:hypothetical protein
MYQLQYKFDFKNKSCLLLFFFLKRKRKRKCTSISLESAKRCNLSTHKVYKRDPQLGRERREVQKFSKTREVWSIECRYPSIKGFEHNGL